jgi:hypothetical protein
VIPISFLQEKQELNSSKTCCERLSGKEEKLGINTKLGKKKIINENEKKKLSFKQVCEHYNAFFRLLNVHQMSHSAVSDCIAGVKKLSTVVKQLLKVCNKLTKVVKKVVNKLPTFFKKFAKSCKKVVKKL